VSLRCRIGDGIDANRIQFGGSLGCAEHGGRIHLQPGVVGMQQWTARPVSLGVARLVHHARWGTDQASEIIIVVYEYVRTDGWLFIYCASPCYIQLFSEFELYGFNVGPMHYVHHTHTRTLSKTIQTT
jgi:hypothetical protein